MSDGLVKGEELLMPNSRNLVDSMQGLQVPGSPTSRLCDRGMREEKEMQITTLLSDQLARYLDLSSLELKLTAQNMAQQASLTQLQSQVNSLSSVDLNEEASSLETFEQSYEAASKIFTVLDQVMTSALNLGVPTTYAS